MSGRSLAKQIGKSEGYVRDRLNDKFEFTLADVEHFATFIGTSPEDFIAGIEPRPAGRITELRPRGVGGAVEDLPSAARTTDPDDGEDR